MPVRTMSRCTLGMSMVAALLAQCKMETAMPASAIWIRTARKVESVAYSEVGVGSLELEVGKTGGGMEEVDRVAGKNTQAPHTGIYLDMDLRRLAQRCRLFHGIDGLGQAVIDRLKTSSAIK